ncbi:helix-turn-helix domain-containing protein [Pseudothioclava nitratireducens]|jgi:transcriptional regulator with XRE-family HTH domain|uniref:helix-turn-helix domain-containing protein n=1 Tax=Pseudothioclava nitratireducens TaxID=1928646 RepID=UPI0023DABACC|nr:helix-turn-helix transcriptional regulator [Defluviimonas nitratireducens]MDF1620957.1 helix-turn-helix transcriptional regulator [Defluviimonas nitratireducens]
MNDWYEAAQATFGDRLAGAREAAGLTQDALAERLGVQSDTIAAWEEDRDDPRANRLQMVAGMLNVSLMWLLTGEGEGLDGPPGAVAQADAERETLREIRDIRTVLAELDARLDRLERKLTTGEPQ